MTNVMVKSNFTPEQKILTVSESVRTYNGTQYTSNDFRKAVSVFGIKHEFIWKHTPEQNGHVESFHKTLKKEYLWRHEFANY